jgi:ribosomal subunit interface protein
MNIQHFEKGFRYTDRDLLWMARKVGKIATYCKKVKDESSGIRVEAERRTTQKQKDMIKMMITVDLPDKTLRAESRKSSMQEAMDRCIEKLVPQLKKYKELHTSRGRARRKRSDANSAE